MQLRIYKAFLFILIMLFSTFSFAQDVLRLVPSDGTAATELIAQIRADTLANGGVIPAGRVYELDGGAIYLAQEQLYVEQGQTLRIRSSDDTKAIIYMYPTGTGSNPERPPGNLFRMRGSDLYMSGISLSGYFEPTDEEFWNIQGGLLRTEAEGSSFYIDNCIISNTRGQALRAVAPKTVKFTDCILTNLGSLGGSNLGAGKGIDLRDGTCDSLILVNNTFTNYQDRVVRHYNFGSPLEGTGDIGYTLIDHNTFYSGMGFHGLLSLGNMGAEATITNNLLVDAFASGEDSTDATRTAEWANNGEFYPNGLSKMSWIFSAPNETTVWNISNNHYAITAAGQAFFDAHTAEPIVEGSPLSDHIKARLGGAADAAVVKIDDPGFTEVQDLITGIMEYYVSKSVPLKTKDTPNSWWDRATDDMDRRPLDYWDNTFDVSYSTSSPAYTGGENGFPSGDLNAFPDQKSAWESGGGPVGVEELKTLPVEFSLSQNYPNPFNPSTVIRYALPLKANVTIKVYDVLGSEVATLVNNQVQNIGRYEVNFDASSIASGIYFYSINAGNFIQTKKMILLK